MFYGLVWVDAHHPSGPRCRRAAGQKKWGIASKANNRERKEEREKHGERKMMDEARDAREGRKGGRQEGEARGKGRGGERGVRGTRVANTDQHVGRCVA